MADDPRNLRKKARRYRRAASVTTDGAGESDRLLADLAAELERQAEELERKQPR